MSTSFLVEHRACMKLFLEFIGQNGLHILNVFVIHINRNKPNFKYVANKYEIKDISKQFNTCFSCKTLFNHAGMMFIIL